MHYLKGKLVSRLRSRMNPYAVSKMLSAARCETASVRKELIEAQAEIARLRREIERLKRGPAPGNRVGGIVKRQTKCLIQD